jgi:hypothetical protein
MGPWAYRNRDWNVTSAGSGSASVLRKYFRTY